jgi:hypothetical protein
MFQWLNSALATRDVNLIFVPYSRHFASVRSDPRFTKLLSQLQIGYRNGGEQ